MFLFATKLLELVKPYRLRLALGVLMGMLCGLAEPLLMLSVGLVIDVLFPTSERSALTTMMSKAPALAQDWLNGLDRMFPPGASGKPMEVILVVLTIPTVMFLRGLVGYLNIYFLQWVAIRAVTDLRTRLFSHLLHLPLSFFHRTSTGEMMSRITNDTGALQGTISNSLSVIVKDPFTLVSLLAFLLWQNSKLTLMTLVIFPTCIIPIMVYSRKVRKSSAVIQEQFAEISKIIHESFTGNRIIKAYNLENTVIKQFAATSGRFISHYMRVVRSMEIPGPLIEFIGSLGVALFFIYMALWGGTKMTPGGLLQFVGSIFMMYRPIKSITRLYSQLTQARASSERVFELLDITTTIAEPVQPMPLRAAQADIVFENIEFNYGDKPVLHAIQLTVKAGQIVALVGSSGSGKTTLTNLLLRFYDPQNGAVKIGGVDIRRVATRDLRSQIAVVTQESILFNDTVRNNIALGRPGATEAEIIAAAKHAHAHEFILEKPQGYDTVIGEKGVTLSGGQKQRLAIARAILKNAPILVLDEATSSLDTESERAVQAALDDLMQHRTTLCIAHRLSTIQHADTIVVLDQGRIVETGTHLELLAKQGVYHKLHQFQFPP